MSNQDTDVRNISVIRIGNDIPEEGIFRNGVYDANIINGNRFTVKGLHGHIGLNSGAFCVYSCENMQLAKEKRYDYIKEQGELVCDLMYHIRSNDKKLGNSDMATSTLVYIGKTNGILFYGKEISKDYVLKNLLSRQNYHLWATPYEYMSCDGVTLREKNLTFLYDVRMQQLGLDFYLRDNKTKEKDMCKKKSSYEFTARTPEEVDFEKIAADLTKESPVVLVEQMVNGDQKRFIGVSNEFYETVKLKEKGTCVFPTDFARDVVHMKLFFINNDKDIGKWVEFVPHVRHAKWANKTKVKVTKLSV